MADMDFRAPQCVIDAMHARAEHGVYGYSIPKEEVTMEVVKYLKRTAHYQVCFCCRSSSRLPCCGSFYSCHYASSLDVPPSLLPSLPLKID